LREAEYAGLADRDFGEGRLAGDLFESARFFFFRGGPI
jgi:hypothetical protein